MPYAEHVKANFFQPFYVERIEIAHKATDIEGKKFDLAFLKFWCSVIDFYGGIYWVFKKNAIQTRNGKTTLSTGASFAEFITDFFPPPDNNYGNFIYSVFRSGIVHQLAPKRSEIHWSHSTISDLVWIKLDTSKTNQHDNKVANINLKKFREFTYQAFIKFLQKVNDPTNDANCENVYRHLINFADIFEDGKNLNDAYNRITGSPIRVI